MKKIRIIGIVIVVIGICNATFWGLASYEAASIWHQEVQQLSEAEFVAKYRFLTWALYAHGFDPFGPEVPHSQMSIGRLLVIDIKRLYYIGMALIMLGAALLSLKRKPIFVQILHYLFVLCTGGFLFMAIWLHPLVRFWSGK